VKRDLDKSTRPLPNNGETLDAYIDRYLTWLEAELTEIVNDTLRRKLRHLNKRPTRRDNPEQPKQPEHHQASPAHTAYAKTNHAVSTGVRDGYRTDRDL
jgi:hypothetical protein